MKIDAVRSLTILLAVTVLLYCDPLVSLIHARDDVSPQQRTPSSSCPQSVKRWDRPFGAVSREAEAVGYHNDGQLSTRHLTDAAAQVTDSYTYDAFGVTLAQTGSTANNYLYTGEQLDPNVGFYYLRARYLNQQVGRFQSEDPFEGLESDPASLHKYLYAAADPVNRNDPSGLFTLVDTIATIAIISILLNILLKALRTTTKGESGSGLWVTSFIGVVISAWSRVLLAVLFVTAGAVPNFSLGRELLAIGAGIGASQADKDAFFKDVFSTARRNWRTQFKGSPIQNIVPSLLDFLSGFGRYFGRKIGAPSTGSVFSISFVTGAGLIIGIRKAEDLETDDFSSIYIGLVTSAVAPNGPAFFGASGARPPGSSKSGLSYYLGVGGGTGPGSFFGFIGWGIFGRD